jgi:hypothetical protein
VSLLFVGFAVAVGGVAGFALMFTIAAGRA